MIHAHELRRAASRAAMLAQARGCFVRAELLEGWPDRPLVRQRLPARRKVKPTRTSPREKYGLQRLSEMGPRLKPQPAPPIVRPAPLDVQQVRQRNPSRGSAPKAML